MGVGNAGALRSDDPISQVYAALWDMLEDHLPFCERVTPGNRVKFCGDARAPLKTSVTSADVPEVRIVATGGTAFQHAASNLVRFVRTFQIQVASGDQRGDAVLWPLEWEILRAMARWPVRADALRWHGEPFVGLVEMLDVQEGVSDADLKRNIDGWTAVWGCRVTMEFSENVLLED